MKDLDSVLSNPSARQCTHLTDVSCSNGSTEALPCLAAAVRITSLFQSSEMGASTDCIVYTAPGRCRTSGLAPGHVNVDPPLYQDGRRGRCMRMFCPMVSWSHMILSQTYLKQVQFRCFYDPGICCYVMLCSQGEVRAAQPMIGGELKDEQAW